MVTVTPSWKGKKVESGQLVKLSDGVLHTGSVISPAGALRITISHGQRSPLWALDTHPPGSSLP